jgi:hypothetical protein
LKTARWNCAAALPAWPGLHPRMLAGHSGVTSVRTVKSSSSPKQQQGDRLKDWYPYYAGFTQQFVQSALDTHFVGANSVLDPWNGSGTTTAVCALRSVRCTGLDVNPAATIIARARLTPRNISDSLLPLSLEIMRAAEEPPPRRAAEPLSEWLRTPAIRQLRGIQHGIHRVLVGDTVLESDLAADPSASASQLPVLAAFFYASLFATARDVLRPFRGSNPTWCKSPTTHRHRINPSAATIRDLFVGRVKFLAERLCLTSELAASWADVATRSVLDLDSKGTYDACLSSPPYATRVDYVRSTAAELAVLGLDSDQMYSLRSATTGTPTVRGSVRHLRQLRSRSANQLLSEVAAHPSHGSVNYYAPWLRKYVTDLEDALLTIHQAVRTGGRIGIVVQNSYYKHIEIDLQRIVCESLTELGRRPADRADYPVPHSMTNINSAARRNLEGRQHQESLLVFT